MATFSAYLKMALARISLEPPPHIDPTKATLAYGRLGIKRLNRELGDPELLVRQRAVRALCDYLHDHEHIAEAIKEGIIISLEKLLGDPDVPCRSYATECFVILCQHELGRVAFLENDILLSFYKLIKSTEVDIVRLNAHKVIELLSTSPDGAERIVQCGYVSLLIDCARNEVVEIKLVVMDTLNHCLSVNTEKGLDSQGVALFTGLLGHESSEVRSRAAQNILRLCVDPVGKQKALDDETIPALVGILTGDSDKAMASAAGALAFICTTTHGRYTALNAGAIPHLLKLVDHSNSRVRVNALKVSLPCLSETPEGRRILLDHLHVITPHENDQNAAVAKHAKIAVSVITWKP
ncbi:Rhabdoid tumor deletion region protein [Fasciola gigantica]|uniref:Rhabdoid tumor deletion region protein n=1 Tax=Fasciola gigantica TaxID=46835 RepID=A0A504YV74_FASGI|nr:Rhabdoid tumor deletion region protein [Fasciola gigantica]